MIDSCKNLNRLYLREPVDRQHLQECISRMKLIAVSERGDPETLHIKADQLLCEILTDLGYGDVVAIFNDMEMWYA